MPLSLEFPLRPSPVLPPPLAPAQRTATQGLTADLRLQTALARQYTCHAPGVLASRPSDEDAVLVTRKFCRSDGFGHFEAPASANAYLIGVDLGAGSRQRVTRGGERGEQVYDPWSVGVRALDEDHAAHMLTAFDFAYLHLPRAALDAIASEQGDRFEGLRTFAGGVDPVLASITQALLPALEQPDSASPLFIDYLTTAVTLHLARRYGDLRPAVRRGGLARWQQKRAEDLLDPAALTEVSLEQLASECRLSRGYFVKAFKTTYGLTPHKWLSRARVDRAKSLLLSSELAVVEIALQCGFVDQSHLTRVFNLQVGAPPARWRRQHRA